MKQRIAAGLGRMVLMIGLVFLPPFWPAAAHGAGWDRVKALLGEKDGVCVVDLSGKMVFGHQPDRLFVPASILKILTALVALDRLGPEFRFKTEFYLENGRDLRIKGYGDPMFTSEAIRAAAAQAAQKLKSRASGLGRILVDETYFAKPLVIPGITSGTNPYEAPNGAFCANFNTVAFEKKKDGTLVSAEPQTPLLPFAIERIKKKNTPSGRIVLTHSGRECALYAGHLTAHFLGEFGVVPPEQILTADTPPNPPPFYVYASGQTLMDLVARLMEFSNNFMANQILLAAAAKALGPPANLDKAVTLAKTFAANRLGIQHIKLVEGSGISRRNRVSARTMTIILKAFAPFYPCLQNKGPIYYKTGTLSHVQTRAGYVRFDDDNVFLFAILINTPNKAADPVMMAVKTALERERRHSTN